MNFGKPIDPHLSHEFVHPREAPRRDTRKEVVQRKHGVGLAPAEIRLELDDGVGAARGETPDRANEHSSQALGQVGAPEELGGVTVLVRTLLLVDLPEVGRELRLVVPPAGDIRVRRHDIPPCREGRSCADLQGRLSSLPSNLPGLFVEAKPEQLHLHLLSLRRLGCRDRGQQPVRRVEGTMGVISGKAPLVCPSVPRFAEFRHEVALGMAQSGSEHRIPGLPHEHQ